MNGDALLEAILYKTNKLLSVSSSLQYPPRELEEVYFIDKFEGDIDVVWVTNLIEYFNIKKNEWGKMSQEECFAKIYGHYNKELSLYIKKLILLYAAYKNLIKATPLSKQYYLTEIKCNLSGTELKFLRHYAMIEKYSDFQHFITLISK